MTSKQVEKTVEHLAGRLSQFGKVELLVSHAPCYGGYRLETEGGSSGFARNTGTEARMTRKEFLLYLQGINDCLDYLEMNS